MRKTRKNKLLSTASLSLALMLTLTSPVFAECRGINNTYETGDEAADSTWEALDYSKSENWIVWADGEEKQADVFWICPTITVDHVPNIPEEDSYKELFLKEYGREEGIYSETGRMFAPFYRQMSLPCYFDEEDTEPYLSNAYKDVSAAFDYYLKNENNGRGIILTGFSQGADMCYRLLQDYFGGDSAEAAQLRDSLIAVYGIGWAVTEEMVEKYPQIVPAKGELDTGVVVSFECEDDREELISSNLIIPEGVRMLSINPLNWKTDGTKADKSLNLGAMVENEETGNEIVPGYCGGYIDEKRGCLRITDLEGTFRALDVKGSLHLYDNQLLYTNLKKNVADRTAAYHEAHKPEYELSEIVDHTDPSDGSFKVKRKKNLVLSICYKEGMEKQVQKADYEITTGKKRIKGISFEEKKTGEDGLTCTTLSFKGKKKGKVTVCFTIELTNGQKLTKTFTGKVK